MKTKKLHFIIHEAMPLFRKVDAKAIGKWGKMNGQQMLEHVTAFFDVSIEKIKFDLVTPVEHLPKYKEFLLSDKEFRENTKAPGNVIGEEPLPLGYASPNEALDKLAAAIKNFEEYFKDDAEKTTLHPVFGELNFEEWVLLHDKHVRHHLKQFGVL